MRNHDELYCLIHGTIDTPARAWDIPAMAKVTRRNGRNYRYDAGPPTIPWSAEEWDAWNEWDPSVEVPSADQEMYCKRGHEWAKTRVLKKDGRRFCRACKNLRQLEYIRRKKAERVQS